MSTSAEELAEFDSALASARLEASRAEQRTYEGRRVVWSPQPGSQQMFMACPVFECLTHGSRGGGKTDALLMSFAQHVGRYGPDWRGILFRKSYPQLADVVAKSERWFPPIFPGARFNQQKMEWRWPGGESLAFRHMRVPSDYWAYHGHSYGWIGWEELTNWADDRCYRMMFSCCRSSNPDVPKMIRSTTNPYGVGNNWVKSRFRLGGERRKVVEISDARDIEGKPEPPRAAIYSHMDENLALLAGTPEYKRSLVAAADNAAMSAAWLEGSWDIIAGGMFSDAWSPEWNELPRFEIPHSWRVDRAFDWGSSKPFSVGWYAESDGTGELPGGRPTVRGDVVMIREWYGWTGRANEGLRMLAVDVAKGIVEREMAWGLRGVHAGPADSSIMSVENGRSIAIDMAQPVIIGGRPYPGVQWTPADKRPGSRKAGWEQMREMIRAGHGKVRERPGLFVVRDECPQFLRTVLALPRDEKDLDDIDDSAEDHVGDQCRYRIRSSGTSVSFDGRVVGGW